MTPPDPAEAPAGQSEAPDFPARDADRLLAGTHDNPFGVLGPHGRGNAWVLRAFVPDAARVTAIHESGHETPLAPARPGGLFAAEIGEEPGPYRLRAEGNGTVWEIEEPYRFGPVLGPMDDHLMGEGTHRELWRALGARPIRHEGTEGVVFAVWAPNARRVSVVGDFNHWDGRRHAMRKRLGTGVWEIFLPGLPAGTRYKFEVLGTDGVLRSKADPVGFAHDLRPGNCSAVAELGGAGWPASEANWQARGGETARVDRPVSIYEAHLGSWRRHPDGRYYSWDELAESLVPYVAEMGFTHLEMLPITEHPFDGSWGYQPVGLYAPTARHGGIDGFRRFVAAAHARGIGLILDWVPAHFPTDAHGLARFDGTALYEHGDPREGYHQDWNTLIYNLGRTEVQNFLIANALYWLREHNLDGLRVDAVASMLYRDYSRKDGEWVPNQHGGRENLEAIAFLKRLNETVYGEVPGAVTIAEESTAWPGVSRPVHDGGLGFGYKWNMGWMHDTLEYIGKDPMYRSWHHDKMTFGLVYAFSENFVLPLSHDEVVHGKGSILGRMPGDRWQQFANLRAYYAFMWAHPGKKLLFMGQEFGQETEWNHDAELPWGALGDGLHSGAKALVRDLNGLYAGTPALHRRDTRENGFQWIDGSARDAGVLAWIRWGEDGDAPVVAVFNFSGVEHTGWRLGMPRTGRWAEVMNTDGTPYGGAGRGNMGAVVAEAVPSHGQPASAVLTLPPLSGLIFRHEA